MTDVDREKIILLMSKIDGNVSEKLFIERLDSVMAKWIGTQMTDEEAKRVSGIENVDYIDKFEQIISSTLDRNRIGINKG